jgi:ELWxxDGT repeat protein
MDIFPGSSGSYPIELTASTFFSTLGTLIFSADDGVHGRQVWESFYPGNSGTVLLKDINPAGGAFPMYFTQAGNYVYFAANDGLSGTELWRTDGTPEGTLEVLDIHAGPGSSMPKYLTAMNGILYFNADDGIHGPQLWRSDGTLAGTYLLDWINPGPIAANPSNLAVQYGRLIFSVYDPVTGLAPWISDGTSAGTVPVHGTAFGAATLQWAPVTQNTDGTPASSLAGYRIYFGTDPASLNNVIEIDNPAADLYPIQQLLPGRAYYFSLTSFTTDGVESDRSAIVAKTLPAAR